MTNFKRQGLYDEDQYSVAIFLASCAKKGIVLPEKLPPELCKKIYFVLFLAHSYDLYFILATKLDQQVEKKKNSTEAAPQPQEKKGLATKITIVSKYLILKWINDWNSVCWGMNVGSRVC